MKFALSILLGFVLLAPVTFAGMGVLKRRIVDTTCRIIVSNSATAELLHLLGDKGYSPYRGFKGYDVNNPPKRGELALALTSNCSKKPTQRRFISREELLYRCSTYLIIMRSKENGQGRIEGSRLESSQAKSKHESMEKAISQSIKRAMRQLPACRTL